MFMDRKGQLMALALFPATAAAALLLTSLFSN